jgi:Polyketide cyclase / dehydrase and lipid transport
MDARTGGKEPVCMVMLRRHRRFAVPIERGFAYITDPANWPAYWPDLVSVEARSGWGAAGDRARVVLRLLGRRTDLELTLRRFEPPRLVEYDSSQRALPDARHRRLFEPSDGGFDYGIVVEYEPRRGIRGALDRTLVRRAVDRAIRRTLDNLDHELASLGPTGGMPGPSG